MRSAPVMGNALTGGVTLLEFTQKSEIRSQIHRGKQLYVQESVSFEIDIKPVFTYKKVWRV